MAAVVYVTPVVASALAVCIPWLSAHVLDDAGAGRHRTAVSELVVLVAVAGGLYVVGVVRSYFTVKLAFLGTHRIRVDMVRATLRRPAPPELGGFSMRISHDAEQVGASLAVIPNLLAHSLLIVFIPVAMLFLSVELALMVMPFLAAVGYALGRSARQTYPVTWLLRRRRDAVAQGLVAALSDLEQVKAQRLGVERRDELWLRQSEHAAARQYLARIEGRFLPLISTAPLALQVLVLGLGAALMLSGRLTPGTLVGFVGLAALFLAPAQGLAGGVRKLQVARVSVERSLRLVEAGASSPELRRRSLDTGGGPLHARVRRSTPVGGGEGEEGGLDIRAGEKLAIIGPTGAGKSRLAAVLAGLPSETDRLCEVSGDAAVWQPACVSTGLRLLSHERWYFSGTLRENITLGSDDLSDPQVLAALDAAGCGSFLEKRNLTLDSVLDEHAVGLSGGERTRLALARTIAGNPRLVVLDAPLAGLDSTQSREVHAAVMRALEMATLVWLDSALADAGAFDRVLQLEPHAAVRARPSITAGNATASAPEDAEAPVRTSSQPGTSKPETLLAELGENDEGDAQQLLRWGRRLPDGFPAFGYEADRSHPGLEPRGTVTPTSTAARCFGRSFRGILCLATVETIAVVAIPWILKAALDAALHGRSRSFLAGISAALLALALLTTARTVRTTMAPRLEERIDRVLKHRFVRRAHGAPLRRAGSVPTGDLLTVTTHDTEAVAKLSAETLPDIGVNALIVVLAFTSMPLVNWRLGVPVMLAFAALTTFTLYFRRRSRVLYAAARTAAARMLTVITETIRGHRDIVSRGSAAWFTDRVSTASQELHAAWLRSQRLIAAYFPAIQLTGNAALAGLLGLVVWSTSSPLDSVPTVVFFLTMLGLIAAPIQSLAQSYDDFVAAQVACARYNRTLEDEAEHPCAAGPIGHPVRDDGSAVSADHVTIQPTDGPPTEQAAPTERTAVTLPSIRLYAGQWLAIVGSSGAGKSTLIRTLTGLVPAASGTVSLLGEPVSAPDQESLRAYCAYLPQAPLPTPPAAKTSGSAYLDQQVGTITHDANQRPENLSLGERHLTALHHALSQQPRVAFLDEPLSPLDEQLAHRILADVKQSLPGLCVVYATHSSELASLADTVVDIDIYTPDASGNTAPELQRPRG